ncbi:MAG: molybdopterin-dependent oxidoreductase [Anaerolineae bacterium]|nr:molybdopterin-dependent oxidoreductase [Anaerolineae bacterium]
MTVRLTIDGQAVEVEDGSTILQAARQNGIYIPTLCNIPELSPQGSCRLCIVDIEGSDKPSTSCNTPAKEGMVVRTNTPQLGARRTEVLRLLLAEHPLSCLICPGKDHCEECMVTLRKAGTTTGCRSCSKDGQCELQVLVRTVGLGDVTYPTRYRGVPVERGDPFFDRDYNLCVLCGRCVQTCESLHFNSTLTFTGRSSGTLVGTAFGLSHLEAGCSFCGACVEVCPTGALSEKTRKWDGAPEQEIESTCVLCGLGCSMRLLSKNNVVIGSLPGDGQLCVKGRFGITELVSHPDRCAAPQQTVDGRLMTVSWDEAIAAAVEQLSSCPPGGFAMRLSADLSSEDLYVAQKFARVVMNTNQVMTSARDAYGRGMNGIARLLKNAAQLDVLDQADAIVCLGLDIRFAQSVLEPMLLQAHWRGAKLYTIHPGEHSLSQQADLWLRPEPGQMPAMLTSLARQVAGETPVDGGDGVAHLAAGLREAGNLVILLGPEVLREPDNDSLIEAVEELARLTNASTIPLAAESNLAGSLLVGAYPDLLPGGLAASDADRRRQIDQLWGGSLPEPTPGDEPSVLYLIGAQPPASGEAFVIYQNIDQPLDGQHADLLLPAAAFSEIDGTIVNIEKQVLALQQAVPPPGEALPSWQILCRIARAMNAPGFDYASVEDIQAEMAELIASYQAGARLSMDSLNPVFGTNEQPLQVPRDTYMGFPMTRRVAGLRGLPGMVSKETDHVQTD